MNYQLKAHCVQSDIRTIVLVILVSCCCKGLLYKSLQSVISVQDYCTSHSYQLLLYRTTVLYILADCCFVWAEFQSCWTCILVCVDICCCIGLKYWSMQSYAEVLDSIICQVYSQSVWSFVVIQDCISVQIVAAVQDQYTSLQSYQRLYRTGIPVFIIIGGSIGPVCQSFKSFNDVRGQYTSLYSYLQLDRNRVLACKDICGGIGLVYQPVQLFAAVEDQLTSLCSYLRLDRTRILVCKVNCGGIGLQDQYISLSGMQHRF